MEKPYLSIVATTRNDDHGGQMSMRMRLFVNGLIYQCNKFKVRAELIMVEWNPPAGKPLLQEVLPKPQAGDYLTLKYVIVPERIHSQYLLGRNIPLFQMIAKNVGIRRAEGEFVLGTNVDLLFSDELMERLARKDFKHGHFYRANRCDIPADIDESWPVEKQLEYGSKNIIARHGFNIDTINLHNSPKWIFTSPILPGFVKQLIQMGTNKMIGSYAKKKDAKTYQLYRLDFEACGDFLLMSKGDWMKIDGYVELDLYSIHVDAMALYAATAMDLEQVILPLNCCTYHIYHEDGWSSMDALQTLKFSAKRPGIDWSIMRQASEYIIATGQNYGINKPDWGFANEKLDEYVFNG